MGDGRRAYVFDALVIADTVGEIFEESFAASEQGRHNHQMHFIYKRSTKVLPDGGCAASDQNIAATRCFEGWSESFFDPTVHEMEGRSSLHFDRSMRLVSEHEDRMMKGRILSPPAGPLALAPGATYRPEHVPTHDGGTHTRFPLREEVIVESLTTAFSADHLTAAAGSEDPFVELSAPNTERMVEILVGPGGVTIERDREVAHEQS